MFIKNMTQSDKKDYRESSLYTLGAVTVQRIKQADLRIGETSAVIGFALVN
jgi:hypothetical protein